MELLLWRWSTAVQIASSFIIAVFFTAFATSVRTSNSRWWMRAWLANLFAIVVTIFHWYFDPDHLGAFTRALYLAGKTGFVLMMIEGVWSLRRQRTLLTNAQRAVAIVAPAAIGGYFLDSLQSLGIAQYSVIFVAFVLASLLLLRAPNAAAVWLAIGLVVRGAIAIIEVIAYLRPGDPRARILIAASSSFDSGAEWLVALGCVLVTSARIQSELRGMNHDLIAAQSELRALADRDPLTGLSNRRSLPGVFRDVFETGATILFFDLDGFKRINDLRGHQAGDEYLKRFAAALRASFRPDDAVIRYAGDEFVVIAPGLAIELAGEHIGKLEERLRGDIAFSVGTAILPPRGNAEDAIREADAAMYRSKQRSA